MSNLHSYLAKYYFVISPWDILLEDCVFEHQMDDALNVHGNYAVISRVLSSSEIEVKFGHSQQRGINAFKPGDHVSFSKSDTLLEYFTAEIDSAEMVNQRFIRIGLKEAVDSHIEIGDVIDNMTRVPNITVRNCRLGKNRARGLVIKTPGKVIIEENTIYSGGAGILLRTDADFWYESGPVKDLTIRENRFVNCLRGPWGRAVIDIFPKLSNIHRMEHCYHKNITIERNTFESFEPAILAADSVDGISFRYNTVKKTTECLPYRPVKKMIELNACRNISVGFNTVIGFEEGMETVNNSKLIVEIANRLF